jgi:hypothetical protein
MRPSLPFRAALWITLLSAGALPLGVDASAPGDDAGARDLRSLTPSALLAPGDSEFQLFHNLYTQTEFFDADGERTDQGGRSTYYTAILSTKRGWTSRVNLGLDVLVKSVWDDRFADDRDSRTAVTAVVPNVVLSPAPSLDRLAIETGVSIPTASDLDGADGRPFLDEGDVAWLVSVYCDVPIAERVLAYLQAGSVTRFADDGTQLTTPLLAFLNFYASDRWTITAPLEASIRWVRGGSEDWYTQVGVGAKFLVSPSVELETIATVFPAGRNTGAGRTINLGIRLLR